MGKIDDMRRLREQQFAAANDDNGAAKKASAAKAAPVATATTDATPAEGKCSACGKMKPLTNGLLASHQKGFGKACPGSRKEPL